MATLKVQEDVIQKLAESTNLPVMLTDQIINELKFQMLINLYRPNLKELKGVIDESMISFYEDLNSKIEKTWSLWSRSKMKFDYKRIKKSVGNPYFLKGPPGHGKTISYEMAALEICNALGLNYVAHVDNNYKPKLNDFLFVCEECAGASSDITFGGLPNVDEVEMPDGTMRKVLKSVMNYRFTLFDLCAGGVLLFDDVSNAPSVIQNLLLPVIQKGTFRGLKLNHCTVGATGNLGALDGTITSENSSALITRMIPVFIRDTLNNFLARDKEMLDELGTVGFYAYLEMGGDGRFSDLPEPSAHHGNKCPRTLLDFTHNVRGLLERAGGVGNEEEIIDSIYNLAVSKFGPVEAANIKGYYQEYASGAIPLAKDFIIHEKSNDRELVNKFNEKYQNSHNSDNLSFAYAFSSACADFAGSKIQSIYSEGGDSKAELAEKEKKMHNVLHHFATSVLRFEGSEFGFAMHKLKRYLVTVNELSVPGEDVDLKEEVANKIATEIGRDGVSPVQAKVLSEIISGFDRFSDAQLTFSGDKAVTFRESKKRKIID
jgi:hypothetical protein